MNSAAVFERMRDWKIAIFFVLIAGAIFLRITHFEDRMILKSDQVRDAMVTERVLDDGMGALPLFGPRAGGTDLRLGPAFYYFQSFFGVLFQSGSPGILAIPVLLFSILSIPLFYFFVRRLFDRDWSMVLTVVFSYGFLAIEYSRFSWNPNSTSFFSLLFLYAFLRIVSGDNKNPGWWYALLGVSYAIASQLHFTNLIALPIFSALFFFFRRRRVMAAWSWSGIGIFVGIVILFYIPVIVSDVLSGGDNAREFFEAIGSKESQKTVPDNVVRVTENFGANFFRIGFGYFGGSKALELLGALLLGLGVVLNVVLFRREKDELKRDMMLGVVLWIATFFLLYIPIATTIDKPRFFLPILFVPAFFFGLPILLSSLGRWRVYVRMAVALLLMASFVANVFFVGAWLSELDRSTKGYLSSKDTVVLKMKKDSMWWTWGQIRDASEFIRQDCPYENIMMVYKGQSKEFMHTFLYTYRLAGDGRIRRSTKYDGPSFCRYTVAKAKPGTENEGYRDFGDLRVFVGEKRDGEFDVSTRDTGDDLDEDALDRYEYWRDVSRYLK